MAINLISKISNNCSSFRLTSTSASFLRRILRTISMSTDKGKLKASVGPHSVSGDSDHDDDTRQSQSHSKRKEQQKTDASKKTKVKEQPMTRGKFLTEQEEHVENAKKKILSLNISEKRKRYFCKDRYTTLEDIPNWQDHFSEELLHDDIAQKWWKRNKSQAVSDVKPSLNVKISLFQGDITTLEIDAIVNAANESLLGGGGVDGAIHRAAGIDLLHECELLKGCSAGDAKITCGYKLPAKNVIHTVGPRGEHPEILQSCYQNSLDLMRENELTTVAFPCISTGIFGYPNLNAARVALKTIRNWLDSEDYADKVERIIFCLFLEKDVVIYKEQLQLFFPVERDKSK